MAATELEVSQLATLIRRGEIKLISNAAKQPVAIYATAHAVHVLQGIGTLYHFEHGIRAEKALKPAPASAGFDLINLGYRVDITDFKTVFGPKTLRTIPAPALLEKTDPVPDR